MVKHTTQCNQTRQLSYWKGGIPSKKSLKKRWRKICLGHWFSSFSVFRITQRACENKFLDSSVLFWGGAIYISSKFPGDTDVAGLKTIRCEALAE